MTPFITLLLFVLLNFTFLHANEETPIQTTKIPAQTNQTTRKNYVAVINISEEAAKVLKALQTLKKNLQESEETKNMHLALPPYIQTLNKILKHKSYKRIQYQNIRQLQKMQSELSVYLKQLNEWDQVIKKDIERYNHYRQRIQKQKELWKISYENAKRENAPQSILSQVNILLKEIQKIADRLKKQYDKALTASQMIVSNEVKIQALLQNLIEHEKIAKDKVFFKNQVSLVELYKQEKFHPKLYVASVVRIILDKYNEAQSYFLTNTDIWMKFFLIEAVIFILVMRYYYLYRKKRLFIRRSSLQKKIFFFIRRPIATYTVLFVLAFVFIFLNRSSAVNEFLLIIIFLPVIRILQTVFAPKIYKYIYTMFFLWTLFWIDQNSLTYELESRTLLLIVNLLLLIYIGAVLAQKILSKLFGSRIAKFGKFLLTLFFLLLLIAFGANLYGSVLLSVRIIDGIIATIYSAMIFYALYIILTGYIVVIMRRRIANASNILDTYSQKIETTTTLIIRFWMFGWWLLIILKKVSLYTYLVDIYEKVLALSFTIAHITISVSAIIEFILIGVGTWAFARFMRTLLEIEIFARFEFPRGVPTAILTTMNYIIIITGTIIAFSSLGVTTQQFALIFGALGVGIGFGLRNIIANFISGIIMVFERPIQIGDTIEVDKTVGKVQNIGARSSTIKTFDGSEVIIPNADFISKEIINWTLSDQHRRKTVEFRVDLDNDIEQILAIMQRVAQSHPDVLKDPKPIATFQHFGEYYLEFKLYFWLSDNLMVAQSEINIGVFKALKEANITMPIPKTDMQHLHA